MPIPIVKMLDLHHQIIGLFILITQVIVTVRHLKIYQQDFDKLMFNVIKPKLLMDSFKSDIIFMMQYTCTGIFWLKGG